MNILSFFGAIIFVISVDLPTQNDSGARPLDIRVQSEMIYSSDRGPQQTCWLTAASERRYDLNDYYFYFYNQENDEPCAEERPSDRTYYAFNRQFQPELAVRIIEDLQDWQMTNTTMIDLSGVPSCQSEEFALSIDRIELPAITRTSEFYVDFIIYCPEITDEIRARGSFSYDSQFTRLIEESMVVIWR